MTPGRDMDADVAERLMGWRWMRWHDLAYRSPDGVKRRTLCDPAEEWLVPPNYVEWNQGDRDQDFLVPYYHGPKFSTDPAACWAAVERTRDFFYPDIGYADGTWTVVLFPADGEVQTEVSESFPAAFCTAALRAVALVRRLS